ncbi:MAG: hypothetical protein RLZZ400_753 [Actinomycetota bacterium]|jgi:prephenate dehydrogenase
MNSKRLSGSVLVVGSGLLGTSIGLALKSIGVDAIIEDISPANERLAIDLGAGRALIPTDEPSLIVVCVPPDVTARVVSEQLAKHPGSVVTDVASVKGAVFDALRKGDFDLSRYIGSHPMAGRERGGALAGRADLFFTRPWVITPNEFSSSDAFKTVEALALDLGATPMTMSPSEHDHAVALVSHAPQVISSLMAARLAEANSADVALAGQGLRDTTRIAASDAALWVQILGANSSEIAEVLRSYAADLNRVVDALENVTATGSLSALGDALTRGNRGVAQIPGKHGSRAKTYSEVVVMIDDKPGQMAKLLNEIGDANINVEDLALEHSPGAQIGLVSIFVLPEIEANLISELQARGWRIAG